MIYICLNRMKQLRKINSKFFLIAITTVASFCTLTPTAEAQRVPGRDFIRPLTADTVKPRVKNDSTGRLIITSSDTTRLPGDSLKIQKTDTFSLKLAKDTLDAPVKYSADDSAVVLIQDKKILLYGKTKTEYKDITLTAPRIELDQPSQVLTAVNARDSAGNVVEDAHFVQKDYSFISDTILYNFKTQRGLTKNTISQQAGGFVHGRIVKKESDNITYIKEAIFTTCNLDDPHFDLKTNKMKVINNKVAISGPAHFEFEGVPIPIYLPFGFYPLSQGQHSGILRPTFETNEQMGLGLVGLGYYQVMNDYWDAKIYGNIYSYGSWSVNLNPSYRKRYHYSGAFNFGLQRTKMNFKGDPDYVVNNSYTLTWNHTVDSRARPGTSFSASVNASSTSYNKYVPNNPQINYNNLLGSSITYSKTWQDKPYNFTASANHSQNNQNGVVTVSLPDMGFTVTTQYPFERKDAVGSKKWYEQLGIGYNGNFRDQVAFYDTAFSFHQLLDTFQWGAQHNIPITLSLPPILNGTVMVSPSVSYSQVWISQKFIRSWNPTAEKVDTTISKGFFVDHQASFGLSFSTAIFGTYQFKHSETAIRHVMRPSISLNYKPDLSRQHFYTVQVDTTGYTARFSEFEGALYSGFGEGKFGGISFQLDNNVEMKYKGKAKSDTAQATSKKLRLIDGLGLNFSYNFYADSMNLSPIQFYFRTNLFEKINISASDTMDPYQTDSRGRDINKYNLPGRISSGSVSVSTSFQSKPIDDRKAMEKKQQMSDLKNDPALIADQQRLMDYMRQNPAEFVDFNIPWSVNLSYSLYFSQQFKPDYSGFETVFNSSINLTGSFNLTPKWNFSANSFYDFKTHSVQTLTLAIAREMHCWQLAINVAPVSPYRYFSFTVSPKSGLLQDLKLNRTRSFFTGY